ncbi:MULTISPECIES: glycoside hydrolase family 43 protein [unclassified Microbacterium]|uniref:glycoside hydrolase family 43 protein n=1 Tax=unclassified Microbacterium TaxID=2609290 RepID=UPI000EA8C37D|nr:MULTISPECIES: glycoside hydrolase family 43 protein [unclassified Microbacterium]RKN69241.1 glycoside hydrolase family 43 protein [Microbacterium sp. CGR2]
MTQHPIIPGYHPDPSICRVGEDYYLANSSFEYSPGVPIFRSRDLLSWTQIGNILERPEHLDVRTGLGGASGGIYAPTLRHHDGRFWMITTNIHEVARGHILVHAENPAGPWSEPVYVAGLIGIDPDIAWDDEGTCLVTWSDVMRGGISQAAVDPLTGDVLSEPRSLWAGTGGAHAEGPHLVRRGEWWYLLVAEGGTGPGHMVTIARSANVDGPFEPAPTNPILTHRSTSAAVQSTGHSDLVELADGSWALVFLATRPRGTFPRWHTNGRETFLAGVDWVDGWPVIDESRYDVPTPSTGFVDDFTDAALHPRWIAPGAAPSSFTHTGAEGLRLDRGRDLQTPTAERLLAVRAEDELWTARLDAAGDVAFSVRIDDAHQVLIERVGAEVRARVVIGPLDQIVRHADAPADAVLEIRATEFEAERGARRGPDVLRVGVVTGAEFLELAAVDGRYLSTEVAGGFTGRVIGVEALADDVVVRRFEYESTGAQG